jgi:hypothetical protein
MSFALILQGCTAKETEVPPVTKTPAETETTPPEVGSEIVDLAKQEEIVLYFVADAADLNKIADMHILVGSMMKDIKKLSPSNATRMLGILETEQLTAIQNDAAFGNVSEALTAKLFGMSDLKSVLANPDSLGDQALIDELKAYQNDFYTVDTQEGMFYLVVDYNKYLDYKDLVTEVYRRYLEIMAREQSGRTFSDAAMIISLEELWTRVQSVDKLLMDFPELEPASAKVNLEQYYILLLNALVFGGDNTPVYDYGTKTMKEARVEFYKTHSFDEKSPMNESFEAFKAIAASENYKLTDQVEAARKVIFDTFKKAYF